MAWAPDYCTSDELKSFVGIASDNTDDDVRCALAVTAASRAVDRFCNRQFGLTATVEQRTFTAYWDTIRRRYVVDIDDLMTVTGLEVAGEAEITDYTLKPSDADLRGQPWTSIVLNEGGNRDEDGITVTAKWGWTTVPTPVKQATLLQASRVFTRKDSPYGIAGSPELGSELRLLAKVDPDVAVVLGPFVRWWSVV